MSSKERYWQSIAGLSGFVAVLMGAAGAHMAADAYSAALAEKASFYQLIHTVALLWLSKEQGRAAQIARWLLFIGIILFCGALYVKAFTVFATVTRVAPLGGISFMAGWLVMAGWVIWGKSK